MPEEAAAASSSARVEETPNSSASAGAGHSSDVMEEAKKLIGSGNRHLVMGDVVSAVSVFQDACSLLAAKYGDTADECGEAFFLCGKSLLELARMENSVLGNALEGVPEESEDDEPPEGSNMESANNLDEKTRQELRQQVYEAMEEKKGEEKPESEDGKIFSEQKTENAVKKPPVKPEVNGSEKRSHPPKESCDMEAGENGDGGQNGQETEKKLEEAGGDGESEDGEEAEEDEEEEEEEEEMDGETSGQAKEEDEEVGNLQLAWEMLEVAKVIYKRKESKEDQLMAAQTYLKLGEVSAESGNHPQALEDFQECLSLQLKLLPAHSRLLAETHYHVATTLCYMEQYELAVQHYNSSISVIQDRLVMLQDAIAAAEGEDGSADEKSELEELKQLLPDIKEKVEDAKESQRTGRAASHAIHHTLGGASTSSVFMCENGGASSSSALPAASQFKAPASGSSSPAASDISHLVRKKRKPEDERLLTDADAKHSKQDAALNGSAEANARNGATEAQSQEPAGSSS